MVLGEVFHGLTKKGRYEAHDELNDRRRIADSTA